MTEKERILREELLKVTTYEEFNRRREEFRQLSKITKKDRELIQHISNLFPKVDDYEGELYTLFPDGSKMIGGCGQRAVKEKGYKSVEDYQRRFHEEWLKKQEQKQNENKK